MAEFDDKLNALLSDPNSMAQIMQLAQSLGGGQQAAPAPPPAQSGWQAPSPGGTAGSQPANGFGPQGGGYGAPQGGYGQPQGNYGSPPPPNGSGPSQGGFWPPQNGGFPTGGGASPLGSLLGGLDPKMIARLLPLVQELGSPQNGNSRALLYALQPYLKEERQTKVERALQLARLVHIGKKFIAGWEA